MNLKITLFFVIATLTIVLSAPVDDSKVAEIIRYESENIGINGYRFGFESSDGTSRTEEAELKNIGTENEALSVRGSISWIGADGVRYTLNFLADENGFQPVADHLPK